MTFGPARRRIADLIWLFCLVVPNPARAGDGEKPPDSAATPAAVVEQPALSPKLLDNYLESGGSYQTLTDGFGRWTGGYLRGVYRQGNNVWNVEVNGQHEFGDVGTYFAVGDTCTFNQDWYGSLTAGSSVKGFFWPRFRSDGFLNKKWLSRKQWITTAGYGFYEAKDVHRSHYFFLGSTYYFEKPWIVEEGIYFNLSNPGTVFTPAGFVALTEGRNKHQYITVRAGLGEEGYQLVGPTVTLTQFQSQTLTITWRKWVGASWGLNFVAEYYHNPSYMRGGSSLGIFKEF
jgi:YaiO family outer membrane protein